MTSACLKERLLAKSKSVDFLVRASIVDACVTEGIYVCVYICMYVYVMYVCIRKVRTRICMRLMQ